MGFGKRPQQIFIFREYGMDFRTRSHLDASRQLSSFLFAACVLLLSCFIHACHSCYRHGLSFPTSPTSRLPSSGNAPAVDTEAETDRPSLTSIFVHAVSVIPVALLFLGLPVLNEFYGLALPSAQIFSSNYVVSPLQSRAPPRVLSCTANG